MNQLIAAFVGGTLFGLTLCGWPWHPRFSRYKRRICPPKGSYGLPAGWMDEAFPLPPPDVMEVINRQLDRDIAAGVARRAAAALQVFAEGEVQRGNGNGGPSTGRPVIDPKGQERP